MSDIGSLGAQWAGANQAAQVRANVRPEPPPPITTQNAVAQILNAPQAAVLQTPTMAKGEWRRETHQDGHGQGAQQQNEGGESSRKEVQEFLDRLNRQLHDQHTRLRFELVGKGGDWRIRIVDQETHQLIRWISWAETQAFARSLQELAAQSGKGVSSGGGLLRVTA